jgi:hypothetical protein
MMILFCFAAGDAGDESPPMAGSFVSPIFRSPLYAILNRVTWQVSKQETGLSKYSNIYEIENNEMIKKKPPD